LRRRDSGFASTQSYTEGGDEGNVEVEDEEEEGEGWGGVKSKMEVPPPTSGMDKDWEEAQWRIKVQEERAVRPLRYSHSSISVISESRSQGYIDLRRATQLNPTDSHRSPESGYRGSRIAGGRSLPL
jgi:hypothetical protein